MTATASITAEKQKILYRSTNGLKKAGERRYANAYIGWLHGGAVGFEPIREHGVSIGRAEQIRRDVQGMYPWGEPKPCLQMVF